MSETAPQLVLASASPRRAELLRRIGVAFAQWPVEVEETAADGEPPPDLARRLARAKAERGAEEYGTELPLLGSDTVVALDGEVLDKPRDERDALAILARLSGRTHQVHTAVAVAHTGGIEDALVTSEVAMRTISPAEAAAYWATGECEDKAGAYAIQGYGAVFVSHLEGSYSGVMGLPLFETAELLRGVGIDVLPRAP